MKTITEQLNVKEFPFTIKDKNGNEIYWEDSYGYWIKSEFDSKGNRIYCENSYGYWIKSEYDSKGNKIYYEDSIGYWIKKTELTLDQIAEKFGIEVNQLKIKK